MTYIATFFTHFGAIEFKHSCALRSEKAQLLPVPRTLSSSCGTCVRFEREHLSEEEAKEIASEDTEQIVAILQDGYKVLYKDENI